MKVILGAKQNMTQVFDEDGVVTPSTLIVLKDADKDIDELQEGDKVVISSISKGKGFQGVVKRHGFHGGPRSHGQKHSEREAGSIGATGPQRVFKGKKMPGRMGGNRVTVKNLKVAKVDKEKGEIYISGAVPGNRGTVVEIKKM